MYFKGLIQEGARYLFGQVSEDIVGFASDGGSKLIDQPTRVAGQCAHPRVAFQTGWMLLECMDGMGRGFGMSMCTEK